MELTKNYASENSFFVQPNIDGDERHVIKADLINDSILFRHDSNKLAKIIMEI